MRLSIYKLAAVSALALSAGLFAMPPANAASLLSHDIVIAQAQSADPGSRKGDVPGTTTPTPAPSSTADPAARGPMSSDPGSRKGDVPGTTAPVPAPSTTTANPRNTNDGQVTADPGSRKGDVPGTTTAVPLTGGAVQCQSIVDMADRQACITRTQPGSR